MVFLGVGSVCVPNLQSRKRCTDIAFLLLRKAGSVDGEEDDPDQATGGHSLMPEVRSAASLSTGGK